MLKNLTFGSKLCIFAKFNTKNTIKRALSRDLPAAQKKGTFHSKRRNFPLKKKEPSPMQKRNLSPRKRETQYIIIQSENNNF